MTEAIFAILLNCLLAIVFAICISYCETHKVRYIIHSDADNNSTYLSDKRYQTLIAEYNKVCNEWRSIDEKSAIFTAKFCMGISSLCVFLKNGLLIDPKQTITVIVSIVSPVILLFLVVYFVKKNNCSYIEFKQHGQGQKSFPNIFGLLDEIDKYSYIENVTEVSERSKNIDYILSLITERISAIKHLQQIEHKYVIHWLVCTTTLSTMSFAYTFMLFINF